MNSLHADTAMAALKAATQSRHQALEGHAQADVILAHRLSWAGLQRLLSQQYQLHYLLEPALVARLDSDCPELRYGSERRKLPYLEQDMAELQLDLQTYQRALPPPPPLPDLATALGFAYVLEGSTLGGQLIARALQRTPDLAGRCQLAYYGVYGSELGARWRQFCSTVNQRLDSPEQIAQACHAAQQGFELAAQIFSAPAFNAPGERSD